MSKARARTVVEVNVRLSPALPDNGDEITVKLVRKETTYA